MEALTSTAKRRQSASTLVQRYGTGLVLLLLAIVFTSQNSRFLSWRNLGYILTDVSICGIVAVGMTFVIICAGVDLAVGSVLGFAAMGAAWLIKVRFTELPALLSAAEYEELTA